MENIEKNQLPNEFQDEFSVFEELVVKLKVSLENLSTVEWNEKVAPVLREFLEWHKEDKSQAILAERARIVGIVEGHWEAYPEALQDCISFINKPNE